MPIRQVVAFCIAVALAASAQFVTSAQAAALPATGAAPAGSYRLADEDVTPGVTWQHGGNRLDVFVRGGNSNLYQKYWTSNGGWSDWVNLGGGLTSSPGAAWRSTGDELHVFVRGGNDNSGAVPVTVERRLVPVVQPRRHH
ncbi:hypothetical protein ETD83_30050 [Actinomadura soli]|uniref:PLL-like beta propeller domain-containing protein n=1 Tax=Actinomadura soli TaxID=2508997 RepID=A0A5C4J6Y4_9ACTN|nr:hypothetical protein [Actinomadura soli]TMQ91622.1 hypothetical protein ETD83_30050 [Actinomadura soli]